MHTKVHIYVHITMCTALVLSLNMFCWEWSATHSKHWNVKLALMAGIQKSVAYITDHNTGMWKYTCTLSQDVSTHVLFHKLVSTHVLFHKLVSTHVLFHKLVGTHVLFRYWKVCRYNEAYVPSDRQATVDNIRNVANGIKHRKGFSSGEINIFITYT